MKRLFVAIKIHPSEQFLKTYYKLLSNFNEDRINWVKPENLHLTLKFVGETAEEKIPEIVNMLNSVVTNHSQFSMLLKGIGIFGSSYDPKIIWFKIENNPSLVKLGEDIFKGFEIIGFEKGRQNFVPHLTIGRIKKIEHKVSFQKRIDKFYDCDLQRVEVKKINLFQSVLKPSGAEYNTIEEFSLE